MVRRCQLGGAEASAVGLLVLGLLEELPSLEYPLSF